MGKYDAATATARRIIAAKGAAVVVTPAKGSAGYDPVTQARSGAAPEPFSAVAVGFPPGKGAEKVIGTLVDRNIIQLYIATTGGVANPEPGCTLSWGGHIWNIIWTATYDPAADGAIFTQAYAER